ncbi:DUF3024 domain-containing protein [Marinobacter sp. G11]|uniref:DUF3024 domain-containing protein n=1 Tax=Marinobacter sp. G11 TaxID=2903522 RepID=UPI003FA58EFC
MCRGVVVYVLSLEDRRPPFEIRPKLDLHVRVSGQSVQVVEICPHFRKPAVHRTPQSSAA